ncbi:hypothetical protein CQW23_32387 [Capsicum baccatum]|uniref:Uncharacterized protein n=1 Tax=Capsicum baccatum TaxID=33114 RepID=A0A2G2V4Z2_CAPBA|nr:hypothetical protein CQW23_32387 [Capsicum baccatum]
MGEVQEEAYAMPKSSYDQCPLDGDIIQESDMLDRMMKQSRAWHTRDSEVTSSSISIGMTVEQSRRQEEHNQDMAHMKTQIDLLTKHFLSGKTEKDKMSMEDMMSKLLKGVEETNMGVTEVMNDLSSINQLVDSYSTAIKQLEQQLSQLSVVFNQRKAGTLPGNTVQNPRYDGLYMDITTQSGKVLENPSKGKQVVDDIAEYPDKSDNLKQNEKEVVEKMIPLPPPFPQKLKKKADDTPKNIDSWKEDKKKVVEKTIPLLPPPFPQMLKKRDDDTRFSKFMTMLKQLTINVSLVEALE